jgi:hypothetical protein
LRTARDPGIRRVRRAWRGLGTGLAAVVLAAPVVSELRIKRSRQPLTEAWRAMPVEPRGFDAPGNQRSATTGRGARPGRAIDAACVAGLSVPTGPAGRVLEPHGAEARSLRPRGVGLAGGGRRARRQADRPECRRLEDLRLPGVLRARPPPGAPAPRGQTRRPGRLPLAPGGWTLHSWSRRWRRSGGPTHRGRC